MKSRRAGRPAVGPAVQVRLPADLLARVQALTDLAGITRPEMIRRLITAGLDAVTTTTQSQETATERAGS